MADASAPQNSISAGMSARMNVKVKYARRRALKDATRGFWEEQQQARRRRRRRNGERGRRRGKVSKKKKMKMMCLFFWRR